MGRRERERETDWETVCVCVCERERERERERFVGRDEDIAIAPGVVKRQCSLERLLVDVQ